MKEIFAVRLKELRRESNISQVALAKVLNVSRSTVAAWESGRNEPANALMVRLADYFEVSVDYLLGRTDY